MCDYCDRAQGNFIYDNIFQYKQKIQSNPIREYKTSIIEYENNFFIESLALNGTSLSTNICFCPWCGRRLTEGGVGNEPVALNYAQLQSMEGEPVWLTAKHMNPCWVIVEIDHDHEWPIVFFRSMQHGAFQKNGCGKTWCAYATKPTSAERTWTMTYFPKDYYDKDCPHYRAWDMSIDDWTNICELLGCQVDDCDADCCRLPCPLEVNNYDNRHHW